MANLKVISFLFGVLASIYANTTPSANYYGDDRNIRYYENYITQTTSDDSMMSFGNSEEEREKEKEAEKENNMDIIVHINPSKNKHRQGYKSLPDYSTTPSPDTSTTKIEKKNTKRTLRKRHKTGKKKRRKTNHKDVNDEQRKKEKLNSRRYQNEVHYNDNSMSSDQTSEEKSVENYPKNNLKHISVSVPPENHVISKTYPKKYQEASVSIRPPKTKKITKKHKKKSEGKTVLHKKINTDIKTNNTEFSVEEQEQTDHMPLDIVVHIKMNDAS